MIWFDEHTKKKTDKVEKRKNLGGFVKPLIIHQDQTTRITKRYYHAYDPVQFSKKMRAEDPKNIKHNHQRT